MSSNTTLNGQQDVDSEIVSTDDSGVVVNSDHIQMQQPSPAELKALPEIENDPFLRLQLKNWEEQAASIAKKIERKETRTFVVKNELYQLTGFYIVFQGVVLTAVAQASALTCRQWWSPFTLSLIASIVAIVGVYQKLDAFRDVKDNLKEEKYSFQVLNRNIQLLKQKGKKFDFANDYKPGVRRSSLRQPFTFKSTLEKLCSVVFSSNFVLFLSVLAFSVVILISCNKILCKG
ncbi:hypothetical protein BDL97_13G074800 [Sphagnum fallax]|nr:hypothetical protein BDL97_13G074800 [Sphagnum fallax]